MKNILKHNKETRHIIHLLEMRVRPGLGANLANLRLRIFLPVKRVRISKIVKYTYIWFHKVKLQDM